jgi:hypothetical protein
MDKKDIIIYAAVLVVLGLNFYIRYKKKKAGATTGGKPGKKSGSGGDISSQSDDYEPYSGRE